MACAYLFRRSLLLHPARNVGHGGSLEGHHLGWECHQRVLGRLVPEVGPCVAMADNPIRTQRPSVAANRAINGGKSCCGTG